MSIRRMEAPINEVQPINYVLVSVFDKKGLDELIPTLVEANPDVKFVSTGGTGRKIQEILGEGYERNYVSVEDLTSTPEMEGGLVKTLTPGVHSRILGEPGNPLHQAYLEKLSYLKDIEELCNLVKEENTTIEDVKQYLHDLINSTPDIGFFNMVVIDLYPVEKEIEKYKNGEPREEGGEEITNTEDVRDNEDIGGPNMIRGAAKNYPNCIVLCHPDQYGGVITEIKEKGGISFDTRANLAVEAFERTSKYDNVIQDFFGDRTEEMETLRKDYKFKGAE